MMKTIYRDKYPIPWPCFRVVCLILQAREEAANDPRSKWPSSSHSEKTVGQIRDLVQSNCRMTVQMMEDELHINRETIWIILKDNLEKRKTCARRSLRPWTMDRVVTGDETWCILYDPAEEVGNQGNTDCFRRQRHNSHGIASWECNSQQCLLSGSSWSPMKRIHRVRLNLRARSVRINGAIMGTPPSLWICMWTHAVRSFWMTMSRLVTTPHTINLILF